MNIHTIFELRNSRISRKLPAMIIALAITTAVVSGVVSYRVASSNALDAAEEKLVALKSSRRAALEDYLSHIEQDLASLAFSDYVKDALLEFRSAWNVLGTNQEETLQELYITDNPNPTGSKEELDNARDGSLYSSAHANYHPWFKFFLRQRGYYDIFLFSPSGDLVYTVYKELDYATNLNTGEWKDSDLGNAFRSALTSSDSSKQFFFDFKPYEPSYGAPASFVSQALVDDSGATIGVIVFQMPIGGINNTMQESAGMGESGETYLVGKDYLMRSDSRFSEDTTILETRVQSETVESALAGKESAGIVMGHRGEPALSASGPISFKGVTWAVMAEINEAEIMMPIVSMRNTVMFLLLIVLGLCTVLAMLIASSISKPILALSETMGYLAQGDLDIEIPNRDRQDEIGEMADSVEIFKTNAIRTKEMESEKTANELRVQQQKRASMNELATQLESRVGAIIYDVELASKSLQSTAADLSNIADDSNSQARTLQTESESASDNINTVASAAEELSTSIGGITQSVNRSLKIAESAVGKADSANQVINGLISSSEKIGQVSSLINDIAEKINLLSLNATIEAARAGEAGKGFAVVASEVKNLSTQAADATQQISSHIAETQSFTQATANALSDIGTIIHEMNDISIQISESVEAQNAATGEIAESIQLTARSSKTVNGSVTTVSASAEQTGIAASSMQGSVDSLARQFVALNTEVHDFLKSIRSKAA